MRRTYVSFVLAVAPPLHVPHIGGCPVKRQTSPERSFPAAIGIGSQDRLSRSRIRDFFGCGVALLESAPATHGDQGVAMGIAVPLASFRPRRSLVPGRVQGIGQSHG